MTAALLLARAGHSVSIFERSGGLGGLWASQLDAEGCFRGDNSCKVYQESYHSTPALFELIGTSWPRHFTARHDLTSDWLRPFLSACTWRDLRVLASAYVRHRAGRGDFHQVSVAEFMEARAVSDGCRAWMRATALGGIAGTVRMTMWELFHRIGSNISELLRGTRGPLFWNAQPPNSPGGFVSIWQAALEAAGVAVHRGVGVARLASRPGSRGATVHTGEGGSHAADSVFLAVPPPALGALLRASDPSFVQGFGMSAAGLDSYLADSVYEHLGVAWFFDRALPTDLPLGGHNVRRGWHPILVQHDQYRDQLRPPALSVVVGSVAIDTDFLHHRLGTRASDYGHAEIAAIVWDDERRVDPSLPEPIDVEVTGLSSATQIVRHGPLPMRAQGADVFLATNMHGQAPYFTASLESAIQAGALAAAEFDPRVERLPTGPSARRALPWTVPGSSAPVGRGLAADRLAGRSPCAESS